MVSVAFLAPYLLETTSRFVEAAARLPGVQLALITTEPADRVPERLREYLAAHWRIDDALDPRQIADAVQGLGAKHGPVQRVIGVLEQLEVPLAQVREHFGIEGIDVATAHKVRDKAQMRSVLRAAGVPCTRHRLADSATAASGFANEVGFPLVVTPAAGGGAKSTFRLDDAEDLRVWLEASPPAPGPVALLEESLTGDEGSFDSVMVNGSLVWHSISNYLPTPLEVPYPWIQRAVLMPRDMERPEYGLIRATALSALRALGLSTGLTHLEWFRRPDGTLAVSGVAMRPPGVGISSMLCHAHDFDIYRGWAQLVVYGCFDPPQRQWSVGAVFLRGQGTGQVRGVHGLDGLPEELGSLVVESRLPQRGQVSASSDEGDGYVMVRHHDTAVVTEALRRLANDVRVELG